ncbi:hypothetical protein [Arthrobacter sp. JSM 101049]|uniref:hypothetical protein n=1 Tax=Arthrobacter sp. JSM 101049 TaxID=929097 RepID=UPI003568D5EE
MLSDYHFDDVMVLAAAPVAVAVIWVAHVILRVRASKRAATSLWILMAGLPVVALLLFNWSLSMPPGSGISALSSPRFETMMCAGIAFLLWVAVGFLELVLVLTLGTPTSRRAQLGRTRFEEGSSEETTLNDLRRALEDSEL